ncbi:hypothetical protein [Actinocorallia aurantiaca]
MRIETVPDRPCENPPTRWCGRSVRLRIRAFPIGHGREDFYGRELTAAVEEVGSKVAATIELVPER